MWDYAIDNSDNSLLTTLVKAYREKEGVADEDKLTFEGTCYVCGVARSGSTHERPRGCGRLWRMHRLRRKSSA